MADDHEGARIVERFFYLLTAAELAAERSARLHATAAVPDTRKVHCVQASNLVGVVSGRLCSCLCDFCRHEAARMEVGAGGCSNTEHVDDWRFCEVMAQPGVEDEEMDPADKAAAAGAALVGKVVALPNDAPHDNPTDEYFLMLVKRVVVCDDGWTDAGTVRFPPGEAVLQGRWLWCTDEDPFVYRVDTRPRLSGARLSDCWTAQSR